MPHPIIEDAKDKMDKSLEAFHQELSNVRTGRANPAILDAIDIEAYGSKMKINQMGTVAAPDPQMLVVDLWDKSQLGVVEKAIRTSNLDMNPTNDGKIIRVPIPPLSEERRRDLVKLTSKHGEEAKIALRNIRRHAMDEIKRLQKEGELPEDDAHRMSDEVQKLTDSHSHDIDEALKAKETDIMEV